LISFRRARARRPWGNLRRGEGCGPCGGGGRLPSARGWRRNRVKGTSKESPDVSKDILEEKISVARELIKAAEKELDVALRSVQARPRAEKTTISQVVEEALGRLRSAKDSLLTLPLPGVHNDDDDDAAPVVANDEKKEEEGPGA
jgi:hypothetical protein